MSEKLKFKIGDEVVTGEQDDFDGNERFKKGTIGTIISVDERDLMRLSYCVEDEQEEDWWYEEKELKLKNEELATPSIEVGGKAITLVDASNWFKAGTKVEIIAYHGDADNDKFYLAEERESATDYEWHFSADELELIEEVQVGPDDTPIDTWPIESKEENKEGSKFDQDKIRMELLPPEALEGTAKVLTFGAKKYADRNWEKGIKYSRVFGAIMRHLWAWWKGEKLDPETGLSHLHHAACGLMFLQTYEARNMTEFDDSPSDQ